jgi:hypothetical protein
LAQRQGLLTGRHLSDVQANSIVILDWIDRLGGFRRDAERELLIVKAALVARNEPERFMPETLFADWFKTPTDDEDPESLDVENEQGKLGVDYSGVQFKGSEAMAEYQELMRQLGSMTSGSFSGTELRIAGGEDGGWL